MQSLHVHVFMPYHILPVLSVGTSLMLRPSPHLSFAVLLCWLVLDIEQILWGPKRC